MQNKYIQVIDWNCFESSSKKHLLFFNVLALLECRCQDDKIAHIKIFVNPQVPDLQFYLLLYLSVVNIPIYHCEKKQILIYLFFDGFQTCILQQLLLFNCPYNYKYNGFD